MVSIWNKSLYMRNLSYTLLSCKFKYMLQWSTRWWLVKNFWYWRWKFSSRTTETSLSVNSRCLTNFTSYKDMIVEKWVVSLQIRRNDEFIEALRLVMELYFKIDPDLIVCELLCFNYFHECSKDWFFRIVRGQHY